MLWSLVDPYQKKQLERFLNKKYYMEPFMVSVSADMVFNGTLQKVNFPQHDFKNKYFSYNNGDIIVLQKSICPVSFGIQVQSNQASRGIIRARIYKNDEAVMTSQSLVYLRHSTLGYGNMGTLASSIPVFCNKYDVLSIRVDSVAQNGSWGAGNYSFDVLKGSQINIGM